MKRLGRAAGATAVELVAIAREAILIPARLWMRAAEASGRLTLATWRAVRPILVAALRAALAAVRYAERVVTPARAVTAVVLCATALLVVSQFVDYRGVQIGAPDYQSVRDIAAAPEAYKRTPMDEHGVALLALAAVVLGATVVAVRGRWRVARTLVLLGGAVVLVSVLGDAPSGLDEGAAALAYEGAHAVLLDAFWVQLSAGAVIAVCGLVLPGYLRREGAGVRRPRRARTPVRSASGSEIEGAHT